MAEILSLHCGELRLDIAPSIGGSIAALCSNRDGVRYDWLRPASREALLARDPNGMASYPLVPFCNRIRDGRFRFQERDVKLPLNRSHERHALHGLAWDLPWTVQSQDTSTAKLRLDYPGGDWPWRFQATQHIQLFEDRLSITLQVQNCDNSPMPIGIGHHPYVPRQSDTRVTAETEAIWQTDAEIMPTEIAKPALLTSLKEGIYIEQIELDNNFVGWNGHARVDFGDSRSLILQAQTPFDFLVLYSPAEGDYFCIEPVSNCTDWLNLSDLPSSQIGGAVLAAGETYSASFDLAMQWLR